MKRKLSLKLFDSNTIFVPKLLIMKRTAVVFGSTGLVGKELVFELLEDKSFEKIKAVTRKPLTIVDPSLEQIIIQDFNSLNSYKDRLSADVYFCCIGTTIHTAGSQKAFEAVDFGIPVEVAKLACELSVSSLMIISSVGANPNSSNFYLRTKGKMEEKVSEVYKDNLKFVCPSLLQGHRNENRMGEKFAGWLAPIFKLFLWGNLAKYSPILSWDVARGMIQAVNLPKEKKIVYSDELKELAHKIPRPNKKPFLFGPI